MTGQRKGRGAQINTENRFLTLQQEPFWEDAAYEPELLHPSNKTDITEVYPKTIVNKVDSPSGTAEMLGSILIDGMDRKRRIETETQHGRIDHDASGVQVDQV